jgi:hypothetical protein
VLTSFSGLDDQSYYRITAINCDDLQRVGTFNWVRDLELIDNDALTDLSGFSPYNMTRFVLQNNDALQNLNGMPDLSSVNEKVTIRGNDQLNDISGLKVNSVGNLDSLIIEDNPQLSVCNTDFVCDYMKEGGRYAIDGNDAGCTSVHEVKVQCGVAPPFSGEDDDEDGGIIILPDPAIDEIDFQHDDDPVFIFLCGPDGRVLSQGKLPGNISLKNLPAGLYTVFGVFENEVQHRRILLE